MQFTDVYTGVKTVQNETVNKCEINFGVYIDVNSDIPGKAGILTILRVLNNHNTAAVTKKHIILLGIYIDQINAHNFS